MKEERWVIARKGADFKAISEKFGIDPLTARLIRNRDIIGDEEIRRFLSGTKKDFFDPMMIRDMDKAVKIISDKIADDGSIRIIGDYDIDGVMGAYILKQGLMRLGARVSADIPDRFIDGYGMSVRLIEKAYEDGVDTIITVDNGIDAVEAVDRAKELGMTVVVTDHHEIKTLPNADAIVDIKREDCPYPNKDLCGGALAYKFICALYAYRGESEEKAEDLLQYAAFATVGDIVDLKGENRIIVKEGLKILRHTDNEGLMALAAECGTDIASIDSYHIGFIMGPCINASGRLHVAMESLELLESTGQEAKRKAASIRQYNDDRKFYTDDALKKAFSIVEEEKLYEDKVMVIFIPDCHEAVAGIVASRIKDTYYRPALVMTFSNGMAKGSGRSIEDYHMFRELSKCSDMLTRFGGHKMAAGFSIDPAMIPEFRRRLNESAELTDEELKEKVTIDAEIPFSYITKDRIREFDVLAPFGKGNRKPLFARRNVKVEDPKLIGEKKNVFKCNLRDETGVFFQGIAFTGAEEIMERALKRGKLTIAYYPDINEFRGMSSIQLVIKHVMR